MDKPVRFIGCSKFSAHPGSGASFRFVESSSYRLEFLATVLISQRQESNEIISAEMVAVLTEKLAHKPLFLR